MPGDKGWCCSVCEKPYAELEDAERCERSHDPMGLHHVDLTGLIHRTVHGDHACAFCCGDPCRCVDGRPAPPAALAPEEILRLGALTLAQESSEAVERLLDEQAETYQRVLQESGPQALVEALVARDRLLAHQGRQIADGRTVSRIAREMVRAALYSAGGRPDALAVQRAIEAFGGAEEVADARQLKLHGSTLGPLERPEAAAEALANGTRKQSRGPVVEDGAVRQSER